jgi:hypothetical protein
MPTIKISHPKKFEHLEEMSKVRMSLKNLGVDTEWFFPNKDYFNIFYSGVLTREAKDYLKSLEDDGAQIEYLPPIRTD